MRLEDYATLSRLTPLNDARGWSESDVPLHQRGVSLEWLTTFLDDLQAENQQPRARALEEAEKVFNNNKAADWGLHDHYLEEPEIPPYSLMNVHCFVERFVKPLTQEIQAPIYTRVPRDHVGQPEVFISHSWNALLVGPEKQRLGTIDALREGFSNPKLTYVWIDFICYNQHLFETIARDMEQVIGNIGRVGFAATPVPLLNRSWCLWELLCSERVDVSPEIFVRPGYRNDKILAVNAFFRSFSGVKASRSTSPRDRADIFQGFQEQFGTFEAADEHIETMIREKLSADWYELHEREEDLQFRPYPFAYDGGTDEAGRAVGIEQWKKFDPYYSPAIRESVLFGSNDRVFHSLIGAGVHVSDADRAEYELASATPNFVEALQAAVTGDVATVERLLSEGLEVHTRLQGMDMLTFAAGEGQVDVVRALLDHGADPDRADAAITPLRIAADKGHSDVVRVLVEHGAVVDASSLDGWTALLWAASSGHAAIVAYLLQAGGDPHVVAGVKKTTPLHMAAANGHAEVVTVLLGAGVAVSPRAFNDGTPLQYALQNGHAHVATLLRDHGAE